MEEILLFQFRENKVEADNEEKSFLRSLKIRKENLISINFFSKRPSFKKILKLKFNRIIIGGCAEFSFSEKRKKKNFWEKTKSFFPVIKKFFLKETPILGICFGHQILAYLFGSKIVYGYDQKEVGSVLISLTKTGKKDPLFKGMPNNFFAQEGHKDIVKDLPKNSDLLAKSRNCKIQAFKIKSKKIYGLQFHPELRVRDMKLKLKEYPDYAQGYKKIVLRKSPFANKVLKNFLKI